MRGWLNRGFPKGHDTMAGLPVFYVIRKAFLSNSTLISWNPYWYLGYRFDWRLPYILGIFISSNAGMKIYGGTLFILSGIFMFMFFYEITNSPISSFISSIFYNLSPFLIVQIFEGHFTHVLGYALTPLVFLLIERYSATKRIYLLVLTGFGMTTLLLSHPQIPILVGSFVIMYCIFKALDESKRNTIKNLRKFFNNSLKLFLPLIIAILLSTYWWLPMVFERGMRCSMEFTLESTRMFTPSPLEVITLRPSSCCSPSNFGFLNSPSVFIFIHRLFIPIFALSALIVHPKNKYVIFFSITAFLAITLAMGVYSPIPLFAIAFKYIPFFNGIRTPGRFLIYGSFSYSVLAGFTMLKISSWIRKLWTNLAFLFVICLLIISSVYGDALYAFQTFDLEPSQKSAMSWLSKQEAGRLVSIPWETWVYTPETRNIVFPWNYVHLHKKEVVMGGIPYMALRNTVNLLNILRFKLYNEKISSIELIDILGIRYIVIDGNYPRYLSEDLINTICADLESSEHFKKVWYEDNVVIYENLNAFPRIFILKKSQFKEINTFEDNVTFTWRWAEGTQYPARLVWSEEVVLTGNRSLRSDYNFTQKDRDWLNIGVNVTNIDFEDFDAISFWYYLPQAQPNIRLGIALFERDGSRYCVSMPINSSQGWHKFEVPFALLRLAYSEDENRQLDKNQIEVLWVGVAEAGDYEENKTFSIYFDNMTLIKYEYVFDNVSFKLIHPGKYKVYVEVEKPSYLILSESYHPQWVAKDAKTGEVVATSTPIFIALNGFLLKKGNPFTS